MSMLEAQCTRCEEIFVPLGVEPEDLIHVYCETHDEDCGGIGIILGEWITPGDHPGWVKLRHIAKMEQHAKDCPNCDDPNCEFHHPEVKEG